MSRHLATALPPAALIAIAVTIGAPGVASARHWHSWAEGTVTSVKLGAYDPSAAGADGGIYGGLELATRSAETFEFGFTTDYFYRSRYSSSGDAEDLDGPYDIPIEASTNAYASSVHLLRLGVVGRMRFPTGRTGPVPFAEGGLSWNILHLRAADGDALHYSGHVDRIAHDTFFGLGWHLGGGIEQPIDDQASLFGEAGYVRSQPHKEDDDGFTTIRYTARASGTYLRGGVRFQY